MEITCPKCGRVGTVKVVKQKKPQNVYKYVVIDHQYTKHAVGKETLVEIVERLLNENWELKMRIAKLEAENADLRERVSKLEEENLRLKLNAEAYREMMQHSIAVTASNADKLDELKEKLKTREIIMLRIVAYKERRGIDYADIE